ncbi:PepSY-associated TM helix domain-containing protein [Methyloversatilis thermotolerans]|uniref:PepSY-associated TM helix domain-containing protein n=1 Tax=Methyloversatilis thermotolerans TaxID=1346290 RepID=UPI00036ACAC5|nr:PepSY-associated TM helix domain-containing protein [Methyloversatilis thermotolerans]
MNFRLWSLIHTWSSLVCTLFLLLLCLTGLPLIFHAEIDHLAGEAEAPAMPVGTPELSMDRLVDAARAHRPQQVVRYMLWDAEEHPHMTLVNMADAMDAPPDEYWLVALDSRTGAVLDEPNDRGFMHLMLKLHTDLFIGLPGLLFMGFMGLLFALAIVSGIVLYQPFMRRLAFGTVRRQRRRLQWLDLHNLVGIVTVTWALTVGLTGSLNTLLMPLLGIWQGDQMADMVAPYRNAPPLDAPGSLQVALDTARRTVPDMAVRFVAFPGTLMSSPHHYTVFMHGDTPLTSRLLRPVLVDARTGALTDTREMPWYMQALLISQPLHFGDYGGLAMKIVWALLDMLTLFVLVSGLYLWWKKRGKRRDDLLVEAAEVRE